MRQSLILIRVSSWQLGPQWLRESPNRWPVSQDMSDITVPSEELMKQGICYFAVKEDILLDIKKIRSYQLLIKITARVR